MKLNLTHSLAAFGILLSVLPSQAALNYNEFVSGDLSGNENVPTPLAFTMGVNTITGKMGGDVGGGIPLDRDFFTFTLAQGWQLTSIFVNQYDAFNQSFYAIAAGTSINLDDPSNHLSNALINGTGEYLDNLADSAHSGGLGLDSPVPSGTYIVWFQELAQEVPYQMSYTVTAVPEPSTYGFYAILGLVFAYVAKSRIKSWATMIRSIIVRG